MYVRPPGVQFKRFKNKARKGIFLGCVRSSSCVIFQFDESSKRVKFTTHAKFDKGFNDLPADNLPPNCQQILCWNGSPVLIDDTESSTDNLNFFVYPFADTFLLRNIRLTPKFWEY